MERLVVCAVQTGLLLLPTKCSAIFAVIYFQLMRVLVCAKESLYMEHTDEHTMTALMEHTGVLRMVVLMEYTSVNKMAVLMVNTDVHKMTVLYLRIRE